MAAAAGNDLAPAVRVFGKRLALEGVDLVADKAGDHEALEWLVDKGFTIGG